MTVQKSIVSHGKGLRAEQIANWYFRLNGFLQIPGFILHSEVPGRQITDADVIAVRFPHSHEVIRDIRMIDDRWISRVSNLEQTLVVIGEVKTSTCCINRPWTERSLGVMEKVIRRIGFLPDEMTIEIAISLYNQMHWQNEQFVVQYVAIGDNHNRELERSKHKLLQLLWSDIATFMFERFNAFGEIKGVPPQWPTFGKKLANEILDGRIVSSQDAVRFVANYIEQGPTSLRSPSGRGGQCDHEINDA